MEIPAQGAIYHIGSTFGPAMLSAGGEPGSGSKKILDRILKPGKLNGNVGNYEDEAERI
jgi:hypothetical protein